ncbi:hypothetical protein CDAR_193681 [Caerostris darwini]|uniref:Uncharacterized protein n=1 Tax=Caerostris darwini TaxID=1538125 RepID=A0AAV4UDF2_9ARAC|nr:hypothetical protein CDAR_193681 [Caerostris darwini]
MTHLSAHRNLKLGWFHHGYNDPNPRTFYSRNQDSHISPARGNSRHGESKGEAFCDIPRGALNQRWSLPRSALWTYRGKESCPLDTSQGTAGLQY